MVLRTMQAVLDTQSNPSFCKPFQAQNKSSCTKSTPLATDFVIINMVTSREMWGKK